MRRLILRLAPRVRPMKAATGRDPDELLHEFASGWLAELRGRIEQ